MFPCRCTADVRFITCCGVIFTRVRYRYSRWGAQLRCFIKLLTPAPRRGLYDMLSSFKFGRSCWNTLLMNSTAGDDVTLISQSVNLSSLCVVGMLLSREKHLDAGIWTRATVVQKVDSAIHRMNLYPLDSAIFIGFRKTYPLDSDLSGPSCSNVG